ncbi:sensor histidine kinase [Leeuwenhoekiella nanhaiensis]|uniref:histidine kinase n=1 Tax=Leeuwenhoekiella nanhaiensis TaxID=1655491 RepID=A0A2G1VVM8_9FLAO|nr:HAMP domain-containing sensor histidine kinase [Leeuwenhoekiella nanhaiensis]PHQ30837.1 two-component sensor histidine kinase [Leeuwenhoekiella nanhaiensis]
MKFHKLSLRLRIFFGMVFLILGASILIGIISVLQYREEAKDYHRDRLLRKEDQIRAEIDYVLDQTTYEVKSENIPLILKFNSDIYRIADVHELPINIYDLDGNLLVKSKESFTEDTLETRLNPGILDGLANTPTKRWVVPSEIDGVKYQSSYTYINDNQFKPLAIMNLPYIQDDDFITRELEEFLRRLAEGYLFMLLIATALSYFLSRYITRSLKTISDKMIETRLDKRNQRIEIEDASEEISNLVKSYNGMIDELENSAAKLAQSEREAAWREMAKQVAHEIKNPLTPMRLTVQSFQMRFDPQDPDIRKKLDEYSHTIIQQIDTMSSIAEAFSNFAKMPAQQNETLNVVFVTKLALDIFTEPYLTFASDAEEITAKLDRTQLIRVVTNLVKNAIQATEDTEDPHIRVEIKSEPDEVCILVCDNGHGISEENAIKVFEPKFTTKSSGMGLGLAMVKNIVETYNGTITFTSKADRGTVFKVTFPRVEEH